MTFDSGPLALAIAMFAGVIAQGLGRHIQVPGIVILLIAGVGLGPDGADVVRPQAMGGGLSAAVGFAVAIILFEGGLSLRVAVLRTQAKPILRLVTVGALVTAVLAAFAARAIMPWDWQLSILFGTLVIVTGPTVITPLVRRLRLSPRLMSILIAEGIFIDAVGATIAVVALEVALAPTRGEAAAGALSVFLRFGFGAMTGLAGGLLLVTLLRVRRLVPHGLENVLVLATVLATYHLSDAFVSESGITAVILLGLVVGNAGIRLHGKVAEFNEQLTALLVATLFVLLAADVRLADVAALGWRGVAVVALLMLVVRPANVFASTFKTELPRAEKLYLAWIAPRGIVAAAVASLFAIELAHKGVEGGVEMRALVFVVIAVTVTVQGLTAASVGRILGVRKPSRSGYLILGANALARVLGGALRRLGEQVVFVERAPDVCHAARQLGFDVIEGDGLETEVLDAAGVDSVAHAIGLTSNEHVNFVFARTIMEELRGPEVHIGLERFDAGITPAMAERHDMHVMFAAEHDLLRWVDLARRDTVVTQRWRLARGGEAEALTAMPIDQLLPLVILRDARVHPFTRTTIVRDDDEILVAVATQATDRAAEWFGARGWTRVEPAFTTERISPSS